MSVPACFYTKKIGPLFVLAFLLGACGGGSSSSSSPSAPSQPSPPSSPTPQTLPVWTNNFNGIPFTMVGTDPSIPGAGTTTIAVEVIPVTFTFSLASTALSAEGTACGDSVGIVSRVVNSPLFTIGPWADQGITIGQTQFPDAYQRANFWSIVSTASPNYHVMLQPVTVAPAVTAEVPLNSSLQPNPNPACPLPIGAVPIDFMDSIVQNTVATQQISAGTLPIFLTYNTAFLLPTGGVFLGYHNKQGNQTYIVASYNDPSFNLYSYTASDVVVLSHEIGEWMDNPVLANNVPAWGQIGIQSGCSTALEVGDPLTQNIYAMPTPDFTYHLQELAYFSWFSRNIPSLAINGRYSTQGFFTSPAPPCM